MLNEMLCLFFPGTREQAETLSVSGFFFFKFTFGLDTHRVSVWPFKVRSLPFRKNLEPLWPWAQTGRVG